MGKCFSLVVFVLICFQLSAQHNMPYLIKAFSNKDSSDYYFYKAHLASQNEADEAEYYFCKNAFCVDYGKEDSALYYGRIALEKYAKINEQIKPLYVYNNMAKAYQKKGEYKNAIQELFKGLKQAEKTGHEKWRGMLYQSISLNYHDFGDYAKGAFYGRQAYAILNKDTTDIKTMVYALNAIAINYDDWGKPDSALFYHMISLGYASKLDTLTLGQIYNNVVNTLIKENKFADALPYITKAVNISETNLRQVQNTMNYYDVATTYTNLARIYYELKQYQQANSVFQKTGKYVWLSNSAEKRRDYYQLGFWINKAQQQYKDALFYSEQYNRTRDSVFNTENARAIADMETQYQVAQKEKSLLQMEVKSVQKNLWISGLSLSIAAMAIIAYLVYRQQKQKFKLKEALKEIEAQQRLQEQKEMISRDLHDNIGSQLTFVISAVDNMKHLNQGKEEKVYEQLGMVSEFTRQTIVELRDMVWAMNNEALSFDDLRLRLFNFIEKARDAVSQTNISFEIDEHIGQWYMSSLKGINIYRSVQEALNNALKYASATQILISVKRVGSDRLQVAVSDNGKGFDKEQATDGMGLINMEKRITEAEGICEVHSVKGKGTNIIFTIQL